VSERRACRVLDQPRRTQRYPARRPDDEGKLLSRMHELVRRHPRRGYRMIWGMLKGEGWRVNRKRVWRLWKREGLKVPQKQVKKRRIGSSDNGIVRQRASHRDHVWAWDFIFDRTSNGRSLKWLSIVDEYTRQCLALEVGRTLAAPPGTSVSPMGRNICSPSASVICNGFPPGSWKLMETAPWNVPGNLTWRAPTAAFDV
jgi:putative transposase